MAVGDEVRISLDHWSAKEWRPAVFHACDAVDETARKRYPSLGVAARFKRTVRDDVDVFQAMWERWTPTSTTTWWFNVGPGPATQAPKAYSGAKFLTIGAALHRIS